MRAKANAVMVAQVSAFFFEEYFNMLCRSRNYDKSGRIQMGKHLMMQLMTWNIHVINERL